MKKNGKNIITSEDITVLGKNSGKSLEEVIETLQEDSDKLKSNVKWLYKYGGVGGSGGGGSSTTTDKWSVICSLGGISIPETVESSTETRSLLFSESGNKKLYLHINNPAGDRYSVEYTFNNGKSKGSTVLDATNRWTWEKDLNLTENGLIHISILNGSEIEKIFDAKHIIDAYSINAYLTNQSGINYPIYIENGKERYNLFIDDIKQNGLYFKVIYNSAINANVTYYYQKFRSNEEPERVITEFKEGQNQEILLNIEAVDEIESLTNDDAAQYIFKMKIVIEGTEIVKDISADFLPNDLYLKIVPEDSQTVLYPTQQSNPATQITGNRTFVITPYNGKGGSSARIECTYFINGEEVKDSNTSLVAKDIIQSGNSFSKTLMFQEPGENTVIFKATIGDNYKTFTYYYYTIEPSTTIQWFRTDPFFSAFYRYQDSQSSVNNLKRNGNEQPIARGTYIIKNNNDIQENDYITPETTLPYSSTQEMLINIGIQYNYINDESEEIIEIPTTNPITDTNNIHIYQNKIEIGSSKLQGIFFIEEEEKYNISDNSKYHLITIARKFIRYAGIGIGYYELSVYIDGVLQCNTVSHIQSSSYDTFNLKKGNYSINLLDISYFNNGSLKEVDIVRYWYAYQTRVQSDFENIGRKSNLLDIFNYFNFEEKNDLYSGHVKITGNTLKNLIQNITVPVMCIEYEPSANKDSDGKPIDFFTWSDYSYRSDTDDSRSLTVGLKWSNGSGNQDTELNVIDTSSILTPDGQQKTAEFTLDIQGSTTRTYKSKNYTLGLKFTDSDNSFIPIFTPWFNSDNKNSFLPENSFTLKADIVDSSHTNNTCMGKFINENTDKFSDAQQRNSVYSGHIKNCLEGFPYLMFVHSDRNDDNYYFLGIYNFNLGRTSNFNLGYCDLRALPTLVSTNNYDFNIYSVARTTTTSQFGSEIKEGVVIAEIDANEAWFDFSQYDESILFKLPNRPNDGGFMFGEIVSGKDIGDTSQLTKSIISNFVKRTSRGGGYIFDRIEKGFHDNIEYNYTTREGYVPNARIQYRRVKNDETQTFEIINRIEPGSIDDFNSQDLINYIYNHSENDIENVAPYGNFKSIVEYYTICMAFGLLDSVQKNLNIKSWNEGNTFYLAFYDMDTCLGINNNGENVSYYAFSDYWKSSENSEVERDSNNIPIILVSPITVYRDHAPKKSGLYDVPSSYIFAIAKYAKSVMQYYNLASSESSISLDTIPTPQNLWAKWRSINGPLQNSVYFIDNYYNGYMEGIDELMFNYNYKAKYFRENINSAYDEEASRFRGRSIGYLRDWLNKRFHMLDAYFNLIQSKEIYINDGANYNKTTDMTSGYQIVYEQYPNDISSLSDDVNVNKSIFGQTNSINGDIDIIVQAPDYTPIIASIGDIVYRYLLEESSNKYNIKIRNNGYNKIVFGGSSSWTYVDSINSLAHGNVTIISDKLQTLNGNNGTVESWVLQMPALRDINLNGPNYTGTLNFNRDSTSYNLTNINIAYSKINLNIENQNVKTINLSYITSGFISIHSCHQLIGIIFNNSKITNCEINPLNYINRHERFILNDNNITNLTLKTDNELDLIIDHDESLRKLNVTGFRSITINNCKNLEEITSSESTLTSIETTNCPKVKTVNLNITSCNYININNGSLTELVLNTSTNYSSIKTLLISQSKIQKIIYNKIQNGSTTEEYSSTENTINLTPLVELNDFDISYNNLIQYIIFPNDYYKPIPIRRSFNGCSKLLRIYGHINIINTDHIFQGLTKFSIHGTIDDTWKGYSKIKTKTINSTNYSIVQTPLQLLSAEQETDNHDTIIQKYDSITKQDLFQEEENVTNITFDKNLYGSFEYFILNTNTTQFDIYYLLNSFGLSEVDSDNITVADGAFHSKNSMFNYSSGNQFNRYTFYKCSKITSFSASTTVFNTGTTLWYSPTIQNNQIIQNNGLFSPLTDLKNISRFSGPVYISRFVFWNNPDLNSISWQDISFIHDDIDQYKLLPLNSEFFVEQTEGSIVSGHDNKLGNMTDMFKYNNIEYISYTFNMFVINYSTLTIPNTIISIVNAFNNSYGFGELNWGNIFNSSLSYNGLTDIRTSFTLGTYLNNDRVKFELYNDMFSNMRNLKCLGANYDGSSGWTDNNASSVSPSFNYGFVGFGFNKVFKNNDFPKNITANIPNITHFVGIFSEVYKYSTPPEITIDFPGNMFSETHQLQNITALFMDARIKINLTSEGFKNCPNLKNVSRLFYMSVSGATDGSIPRMLSSQIPYNFFYLGENTKTKTYYGTNDPQVMNNDILYTQDPDTGEAFDIEYEGNQSTINWKEPIKSIQYATECFHGQDRIHYYEWDDSEFDITKYPNSNYIPFKYYKEDNVWKTRPDDPKYIKLYDISSIYDGNYNKLKSEAYCQDSDEVQLYNGTTNKSKILNYFCPPDLFNSFVNNSELNINGMFKWCGKGSADVYGPRSRSLMSITDDMSGRICPYLFNTVNNIKYLIEFFENCKNINSYGVNNTYYLIPPSLFENTKNLMCLAKTFSGMYFDVSPNYSFLSRLTEQLDVRGIFSMCLYETRQPISGVFNSNTLGNVSGAFAARVVTLVDSNSGYKVSLNTNENNVRQEVPPCRFENIISNSQNASRQIVRDNTGFVYYKVGTDDKVQENPSILDLNYNHNLT